MTLLAIATKMYNIRVTQYREAIQNIIQQPENPIVIRQMEDAEKLYNQIYAEFSSLMQGDK